MEDCFAVCAPGLELLLRAELGRLGLRTGRTERGGVSIRASTRQLYAANVWLRTASRVLVRVARFEARTFAELERHASSVPWPRWLAPDTRATWRVSSSGSRLFHTGAIAERLTRAAGSIAGDDAPQQPFVVRVQRDTFSISVDASGEHLHRRGWRLATAKAPMRETHAAALILASGWDPRAPLVDPFCGSGTIAIEAALFAQGRPPGARRDFAFQRWPSFEPGTWASVREEVRHAEREASNAPAPIIVAADRDAGAVRAASDNAERAGVAGVIDIRHAALSETAARMPDEPGYVVTNPPYGARVGGNQLRDLYAALGGLARGPLAAWHLAIVIADRGLARHLDLRLEDRVQTTNGGIPITFATAAPREMGSLRPTQPRR